MLSNHMQLKYEMTSELPETKESYSFNVIFSNDQDYQEKVIVSDSM